MSDKTPPGNSDLISQQILQTAGFYPPTIYDLLTRYGSLITKYDDQSTEFLPVTDVRPPTASQTLPFIVGFIPPPAPTGNLISREASVAAFSNNSPTSTPLGKSNPGTTSANGTATSLSNAGRDFIFAHEVGNKYQNGQLDPSLLKPYNDALNLPSIGVGHLIQPSEQAQLANGITNEQALELFNKDSAWVGAYIQQNVHVPLTQNQYDACASFVFSAGHLSPTILNALNRNDYDAAAAAWPTQYTGGKNSEGEFQQIPFLATIRQNEAALFKAPDGQFGSFDSNIAQRAVTSDVPNSNSWNEQNGSKNAQSAAQVSDSVANTTLNTTELGKQFAAQQQAQAQALQFLVQQMAQTPPLRLLVNPRSFKTSMEKIIADGNSGRNGPIIEHWGEQLDKIEGSGKIAAFYSIDNNPPGMDGTGSSSAGPGLSRMTRNYSTSYQNLLSLYLIYRNNAEIWTPDYVNANKNADGSWAGQLNLATLGSIYIYYDNILYIGCFENFNIVESDDAPFSLEYTFNFTVRAWFELDRQLDPLLSYQQVVTGNAQLGIKPQNGTVPTVNDISQFGPSGGQPSDQQASSQQLAAQALQEQINTEHEQALFGGGGG